MAKSFRITELWAYVSIGDDDEEGVCGASIGPGGTMLPLIAADETRLRQLMPVAIEIAIVTGKCIKLVKFTKREEVIDDVCDPDMYNTEQGD
jgi:hypothetical protein